jgi:hypothetical protein
MGSSEGGDAPNPIAVPPAGAHGFLRRGRKKNLPLARPYAGRLSRQNGRTFLVDINVRYP